MSECTPQRLLPHSSRLRGNTSDGPRDGGIWRDSVGERGVGRSLAIGFSLANLWFIGVWSDLLPFLYLSDWFPIGGLPCWNDFAAAVLNVCVVGVALSGLACLSRGTSRLATAAGWLLLASLAVPLNAIRYHFHLPGEYAFASLDRTTAAAVLGLATLCAAFVAVRWRTKTLAVLHASLVIIFPLMPLLFAQSAWAISQAGGRLRCTGASDLAAPFQGVPSRRVLLVVYDELEQHATFEARPGDLRLPAFDKLRAESVAASAMVASAGRTERSMPAILTGREVTGAVLVGRNRLQLTLGAQGGTDVLEGEDTVFARARGQGVNTGLAGFFLPYCSMLSGSLTRCTWEPCVTCGRRVGAFGDSVLESMANQVSELAPRHGPRRHMQAYRSLQAGALDLVADPTLGMVLVHLNVPHDPAIYDRRIADFSLRSPARRDYYDNLALADRSLGELRQALADSGLADRTSIVVFGDHARRSLDDGMTISDPRVPFLVRLPRQGAAVAYAKPLTLLVVHDLALELLAGRLQTTAALTNWLDARAGP